MKTVQRQTNRKPGPLRVKEDSDIHSSDVGVRCDW
jgi:hypothetical protein